MPSSPDQRQTRIYRATDPITFSARLHHPTCPPDEIRDLGLARPSHTPSRPGPPLALDFAAHARDGSPSTNHSADTDQERDGDSDDALPVSTVHQEDHRYDFGKVWQSFPYEPDSVRFEDTA